MLPPNRPKLAPEKVRKIAAAKRLPLGKVALVGIRGYYEDSMGKPDKNDRGVFDDAFFIVLPDRVLPFNGNTDPSAYKHGMASLMPGIWRFIAGKHKIASPNGYPAFRQLGNVSVMRDDQGLHTGYFGINLHRGGISSTSSLGCQTVPQGQWLEFRDALYEALGTDPKAVASNPGGVPGASFSYLLITHDEAEQIAGTI